MERRRSRPRPPLDGRARRADERRRTRRCRSPSRPRRLRSQRRSTRSSARLQARRASDLRRRRHFRPARRARRRRVRGDVLGPARTGDGAHRRRRRGHRRSSRRPPRTTRPPASASSRRSASGPPTPSSRSARAAARRTCSARSPQRVRGRCVDRLPRLASDDSELARFARARARGRRRPRDARRLDAAQGRDEPEARAEHDLDDLDDPARQDLREPDGRRLRRRTRSCEARVGESSDLATGAPPDQVDEALARRGRRREGGDRRRSSRRSTRRPRKARLAAAGGAVRQALEP